MYNFAIDEIPLLLPVHAEVQLQPWFSAAALTAGLQLIREGGITHFQSVRQCVGACLEGGATVSLLFEQSSRLAQGFLLRSEHCGICGHAARRQRCAHMAALAILSLQPVAGESRPKPMPLAFAASHWAGIGEFLHDWLNRGQYTVERTPAEGGSWWRLTAGEGRMEVLLPAAWLAAAEYLLSSQGRRNKGTQEKSPLGTVMDTLQTLAMTDAERQLAAAGSVSVAWRRETSLGLWLAKMLFVRHGGAVPSLGRRPGSFLFTLEGGEPETLGAFLLTLPRARTWEVVKNIPFPADRVRILPEARECFRVSFNDEHALEVMPSLRLADGRVLDRQTLAGNNFPGAWYLPGEGFAPTVRIPAEGDFKKPNQPAQSLSLLGFLQAEENRDAPFTVAPGDLPSFLAANRNALNFPDNLVDPSLLCLEIVEYPERLLIDGFEEGEECCHLRCRLVLGGRSITLGELGRAWESNLRCLPGKSWLQLAGTPLSWFYQLVRERLEPGEKERIRLNYLELFRLTALIPEVEILVGSESSQRRIAAMLEADRWADGSMLADIPGHLRPYQGNGLAWLLRLARFHIGGLLADDMGLGKTHQGLALLRMLAREDRKARFLVVCPASVVLHWVGKIERFYPELDWAVYYGANRELAAAMEHAVIITTYGVVRQDAELLREQAFSVVLLDEIQQAKNSATATHQAVAGLDSRVKIGLTGTPIENSLQDLRSLFAICLPGLLGSEQHFARYYAQPITEAGDKRVRERLARLIHPFLLRRSRSQVLPELPPVIEDDRLCALSDEQALLYREVLASRSGLLAELEDDNAAIPYMHVLATITRLKRVCCHPCLLYGSRDPREYDCGKWELFVELSEELLDAGMKFVVFSQYLEMLTLFEEHFERTGIGVAGLRGEMTAERRQTMIERFNHDPDCRVFCASLLAGGVGIDLTGAQAVIHYDRWWNPAREEQATARVHRLGQKSVVQVFRLITTGTLEEKIHQLLQSKRRLAEGLIEVDEAGVIKQLDRRQLAELFAPFHAADGAAGDGPSG